MANKTLHGLVVVEDLLDGNVSLLEEVGLQDLIAKIVADHLSGLTASTTTTHTTTTTAPRSYVNENLVVVILLSFLCVFLCVVSTYLLWQQCFHRVARSKKNGQVDLSFMRKFKKGSPSIREDHADFDDWELDVPHTEYTDSVCNKLSHTNDAFMPEPDVPPQMRMAFPTLEKISETAEYTVDGQSTPASLFTPEDVSLASALFNEGNFKARQGTMSPYQIAFVNPSPKIARLYHEPASIIDTYPHQSSSLVPSELTADHLANSIRASLQSYSYNSAFNQHHNSPVMRADEEIYGKMLVNSNHGVAVHAPPPYDSHDHQHITPLRASHPYIAGGPDINLRISLARSTLADALGVSNPSYNIHQNFSNSTQDSLTNAMGTSLLANTSQSLSCPSNIGRWSYSEAYCAPNNPKQQYEGNHEPSESTNSRSLQMRDLRKPTDAELSSVAYNVSMTALAGSASGENSSLHNINESSQRGTQSGTGINRISNGYLPSDLSTMAHIDSAENTASTYAGMASISAHGYNHASDNGPCANIPFGYPAIQHEQANVDHVSKGKFLNDGRYDYGPLVTHHEHSRSESLLGEAACRNQRLVGTDTNPRTEPNGALNARMETPQQHRQPQHPSKYDPTTCSSVDTPQERRQSYLQRQNDQVPSPVCSYRPSYSSSQLSSDGHLGTPRRRSVSPTLNLAKEILNERRHHPKMNKMANNEKPPGPMESKGDISDIYSTGGRKVSSSGSQASVEGQGAEHINEEAVDCEPEHPQLQAPHWAAQSASPNIRLQRRDTPVRLSTGGIQQYLWRQRKYRQTEQLRKELMALGAYSSEINNHFPAEKGDRRRSHPILSRSQHWV